MKKISYIWLFMIAVVALPVSVFAVVKWYENNHNALPVMGEKGHKVAGFAFTDQHNKPANAEAWKGKIVVANFFFTHCPVVCPKMTVSLKKVQAAFKGDNVLLIQSFTVDPERDSASQLKKFAERFKIDNSNWQLLTGKKIDLYRLARKSFLVVATDGDGGPEDFIHSEKLVLVDGQQRIRGYYDGTDEAAVQQLITDIGKLKKEPRNN